MPVHRRAFPWRLAHLAVPVGVIAAAAASVLAGLAIARTFTLTVAKNAPVTNTSGTTARESIIVTSRGLAVYALSGDSAQHPKCTKQNGCFAFWPPLRTESARALSRAAGIKGKLGTWRRDGFLQVTLAGHPLYTFAGDQHRDMAIGEGIHSFGGTWHVSRPGGTSTGSGTMGGSPTPTPTPTPTSPTY